jgi:protocatechuate 3,4-dioxygenase alpha subunit
VLKQTPSQTVGPYFSYGLTPEAFGRKGIASNVLVSAAAKGKRIRIEGALYDGEGKPVTDALVEIWQANAAGRYRHPSDRRDAVPLDDAFTGFGRAPTDAQGLFRFDTVKPGRVPGRGNALQAPHIGVIVLARGMLNHVFTRLYFADETDANKEDPVLQAVEASRRGTLIAQAIPGHDPTLYRLDIRLQGPDETVFFDA